MPYSLSKGGGSCSADEWAVISDSGQTMGCHANKQDALDQQAALYVNVPDASASATAPHHTTATPRPMHHASASRPATQTRAVRPADSAARLPRHG